VLRKATGEEIEDFREGAPEQFLGRVKVHSVSEVLGTDQVRIRAVYFESGARARPHLHSADQLLYFPQAGIVAIDGGPDEPVASGQYVLLPGGIVHMHGAGEDAPAVHISMMREIDSDFDCPIVEEWSRYRAS
jgi:quercetin dioxygenase-like cupin family protein